MNDHTLAIVFRNPNPQRSQVHTELYLFRRDGSCSRIDYRQGDFDLPEESTSPRAPLEMR